MNRFRTITAAGVATLALASGAAFTGSAAVADDGGQPAPPSKQLTAHTSARIGAAQCSGGAAIGMHTGSGGYVDLATSYQSVPGSGWTVRGPQHGKDTMLVTLTSQAYSGYNYLYTRLYHNNNPMGPERFSAYDQYYASVATQWCVKFGRGVHNFDVRAYATGTGSDLIQPTITYQRFN